MADRDYKVVYKSRNREQDPYEAEYDDRRYRRQEYEDYDYDDRYGPSRRAGDVLERTSTRSDYGSVRQQQPPPPQQQMALAPRPRHNTRTEYDFVQDRDDLYPRGSNVIVLDTRDRDLSEWEIIRPERSESGALVIDLGAPPQRSYGYDDRRPRELEVYRGGDERPMGRSRSIVSAMREVRVTEDESDRRSMYSRGRRAPEEDLMEAPVAPVAPRRVPTAVRHDHSPESDIRRRSRSIGFHKSQLRHHDVTETRHERPGAEAANAGQYLIGHRGERLDEDYDGHASLVGPARPRDRSRRRRSRYYDDDDHDREYEYDRRDKYYEEGINRDFEQRSQAYSPQRAPSPRPDPEPEAEPEERERRHRRHRRRHRRREEDRDDDGSYVSEHYSRREKRYRD